MQWIEFNRSNQKINLKKRIKKYDNTIAILCHIKACTPQSADVERSVKADNLFKTTSRNKLNLETENKYMYVYFNMPALEMWDPRDTKAWINEKSRREHTDLLQKSTAKKKSYFKGIFKEADDDDSSDYETSGTERLNSET